MVVVRVYAYSKEQFVQEIDAMTSIPGCCDTVWIGGDSHLPISHHEEYAVTLKECVEYARSKGLTPMFELQGLGHGDSRSPANVGADNFERMVGADGFVADGAYCPWGKNMQAYYVPYVSAYAKLHPAGVYIDDDLRMEFHGRAEFGCFCDDCIKRFNTTWNTSFTREEIVERIRTDSVWRERYVKQNVEGMADFMRNVSRAVHAVSPETQVGWEYVFLTYYTGSDWEPVFRAIYEETGLPPLSRPGALVYEDHAPRKLINKVINTSYQNAVAPDYVVDRWPEIENTSHTIMGKSVQGTCVEATLNLAYGCNGITVSMLSAGSEPLEKRYRMWRAFAQHNRYWKQLIDDLPGTGVGGLCIEQDPDGWKTVQLDDKGFDWVKVTEEGTRKLVEVGLPLSYEKDFCKARVLHPDVARNITEKELQKLLAGRVLTDAKTIDVLRKRGFGASFPAEARPGSATTEIYTDHPANRELAGQKGVLDNYTPKKSPWYYLVSTGEGCEPLGYAEERLGSDCTMTKVISSAILRTAEGGVWGVIGQSLWTPIVNSVRRRQLSYLADYLTDGLPAYFETDEQAMLIPRVDKEGYCTACTVLNLTIGKSEPYKLALRVKPGTPLVLCRPEFSDLLLPVEYDDKGVAHVTLPVLDAWSTATVRPAKK